jgi:CxxC motif-containing protein
MKEEIICTVCPLGCSIEVVHDGASITSLTGNRCQRGVPYARQEVFHPLRTVTTTVAVSGGEIPFLPVKTARPVPRDAVSEVMRATRSLIARAPVRCGDSIASDIAGSGIDLVATRTVMQKKPAG